MLENSKINIENMTILRKCKNCNNQFEVFNIRKLFCCSKCCKTYRYKNDILFRKSLLAYSRKRYDKKRVDLSKIYIFLINYLMNNQYISKMVIKTEYFKQYQDELKDFRKLIFFTRNNKFMKKISTHRYQSLLYYKIN